MKSHSITLLAAALLTLAAACDEASSSGPDGSAPGVSGKADNADDDCALTGTWTATGDWPSFTDWTFSLDAGALTRSETDDLPADEWASHLLRDAADPTALSLLQVTRAGDAVIQSTVNLAIDGCANGVATLEVTEAYTVTIDLTDPDSDWVERHEVVVIEGAP